MANTASLTLATDGVYQPLVTLSATSWVVISPVGGDVIISIGTTAPADYAVGDLVQRGATPYTIPVESGQTVYVRGTAGVVVTYSTAEMPSGASSSGSGGTSSSGSRALVEPLGQPIFNQVGTATVSAACFNNLFTPRTARVSLSAEVNTRFAFGVNYWDAISMVSATIHSFLVRAGTTRDFSIPAGATNLAYIRDNSATADGAVEALELT